jgi:hypothetical protein
VTVVDERDVLAALEELGPPAYKAYRAQAYPSERLAEARRGRFLVQGQPVELRAPVDWRHDFGSRSWEFTLHTFEFVDVLLYAYTAESDTAALDQAVGLALDWIEQNPRGGSGTSTFAWYDMAAGIRAPYLAFTLRSASRERRITARDASTLLSSLVEHGKYLADDANYAHGHNHGLFQDEGLVLLAEYLPFLDQASAWAELGSRRAIETLKATVDWHEAIHLEHSPAYHCTIANLVTRLCRQTSLGGGELATMRDRLVDNAGWFVLPDGTLPETGDTDHAPAAAWAQHAGAEKQGLATFLRSGLAIVKEPETYLIVSAGYHSHAHKHADELSFFLFASGRRVIADAGRYGYYESEPDRIYARSSQAHNTLVVDGASFDWEGAAPYGSGLRASGEGAGWYAIAADNPLLLGAGVAHRRLLLLKPGAMLLVVDELEAREEHVYTRFLHFGPDLDAREDAEVLRLAAPGFSGAVTDWGPAPATRRLVRGREAPELRGWTFPSDRTRLPVWTAEYEARAASATFAFAISLDGVETRIRTVERAEERFVVELARGGDLFAIGTTRDDTRLSITEEGL